MPIMPRACILAGLQAVTVSTFNASVTIYKVYNRHVWSYSSFEQVSKVYQKKKNYNIMDFKKTILQIYMTYQTLLGQNVHVFVKRLQLHALGGI